MLHASVHSCSHAMDCNTEQQATTESLNCLLVPMNETANIIGEFSFQLHAAYKKYIYISDTCVNFKVCGKWFMLLHTMMQTQVLDISMHHAVNQCRHFS